MKIVMIMKKIKVMKNLIIIIGKCYKKTKIQVKNNLKNKFKIKIRIKMVMKRMRMKKS